MDHTLAPQQQALYDTVTQAIVYLRTHARRQPSLQELAEEMGYSEGHLQRVFSEWAGISPKRFLQYLTKDHALKALRNSSDILGAALEAGLSGPGRLHDLMINCEAMTPGEIKRLGAGLHMHYGAAATPFGAALIAWTERGICHFEFYDRDFDAGLRRLIDLWPNASFSHAPADALSLAKTIFPSTPERGRLHLLLRGTNFQIKVWEALLRVEPGQLVSYSRLAAMAGAPSAPRAVGSALASNSIAYLIPCHRVIRDSGDVNQYRWGTPRKAALIAWEAARAAADGEP